MRLSLKHPSIFGLLVSVGLLGAIITTAHKFQEARDLEGVSTSHIASNRPTPGPAETLAHVIGPLIGTEITPTPLRKSFSKVPIPVARPAQPRHVAPVKSHRPAHVGIPHAQKKPLCGSSSICGVPAEPMPWVRS